MSRAGEAVNEVVMEVERRGNKAGGTDVAVEVTPDAAVEEGATAAVAVEAADALAEAAEAGGSGAGSTSSILPKLC